MLQTRRYAARLAIFQIRFVSNILISIYSADGVCCARRRNASMSSARSDPVRVWHVMNKAAQAIERYALKGILQSGLGDSDFRVLEVLLHKGPLPVNTIGP